MSTGEPTREHRRKTTGPVLFEYGFRPFFLGAGIYAAMAMLAWTVWIGAHLIPSLSVPVTIAMPVHQWHAHEMIFGYGLAVVAGFFLTSVPSWTGRRPVAGPLLAVLFGLWVAARLASWFSGWLPPLMVAIPELAFIGMLTILVAQALLSGWSHRNFVFLPVLAGLFVAALLSHMETLGLLPDTTRIGNILGLDTLLVLISVLGGRVVPAFTTNALRRDGVELLPRGADWRDGLAIVAVVAVLLADLVAYGSVASGWIAVVAGLAAAIRMAGWRTSRVLDSPILWILHLGYFWLAIGFLLKGAAIITGEFSQITALHALTIGAIGSMTIGVMSRAALGHTGRVIKAPPLIVAAYVLISLAAILRLIGAAAGPALYDTAMLLSGGLWIATFLAFTLVFWPILTKPRN